MKKLIISLCALLVLFTSQAQEKNTALSKLDAQLKQWLAYPEILMKDQPALFKNSSLSGPKIPIVFKATSPSVYTLITGYGGEIHTQIGDIYTAIIPLDALIHFVSNKEILQVESTARIRKSNHRAKQLTGADMVHNAKLPEGMAYTGKGVIVGVFDTGLDFSHTDFREQSDNTKTRILSLWDQNQNDGTSPQNYNYGTEYTGSQINAALNTPGSLNTIDAEGHGTHVTGSAAGLRGMAPDAEIVFVAGKVHWESDSTLYQDTKSLLDGLNYIKEKAKSAGKPCVVNLSIVYNIGSPHDGSSLIEQAIDNLVSSNKGFFVVVSAGNENELDMHFGGFELSSDSIWTYMKTEMLYTTLNSAYDDSTFISFVFDSAVLKGPAFNSIYLQKSVSKSPWMRISDIKNAPAGIFIPGLFDNGDTCMVVQLYGSDFNTIKTELRIFTRQGRTMVNDTSRSFGTARMFIRGKGRIDAWWEYYQTKGLINPLWYENYKQDTPLRYSNNESTMNILACGHKTISVGAFVNQTRYRDFANRVQYGTNYNRDSSGSFAYFSSLGPTTDGRIKPDISSPGLNVASSRARNVSFFGADQVDSKTVVFSGTSMASPIVAGAIALYLEKFPSASLDDVRMAITSNAIVDSLVTKFGAVPNNHFGYGRLDIYKAMGGPFHTGIRHGVSKKSAFVYPNPASDYLYFEPGNDPSPHLITVFEVSGKQMGTYELNPDMKRISLLGYAKGIYYYVCNSQSAISSGRFIVE